MTNDKKQSDFQRMTLAQKIIMVFVGVIGILVLLYAR